MRILKYSAETPMSGGDVEAWQRFLITRLALGWGANGIYGPKTRAATVDFQTREGLVPIDGKVGDDTLARALALGFVAPPPVGGLDAGTESDDPAAPAPGADPSAVEPDFPGPNQAFVEASFGGRYRYVDASGDDIRITDGWESQNIRMVPIPQLAGITLDTFGGSKKASGRMQFNKRGADQLVALWKAWDDAGLVGRIKTYSGSFVARYKRDSVHKHENLSNHAYGTAFDINLQWNKLGKRPAALGALGSVRELVQLANAHGFYWGGHYDNRKDGMHFEVGKLL